MRRSDREITNFDDMVAILEHSDVCRLGMVDEDGMAYIVPLNYGFRIEEGKSRAVFPLCQRREEAYAYEKES